MASILKSLRLLADGTRIRIVLLLDREELSVTELQEILGIGQSTLSTHLSQLKQAAIVEDRRTGKNILYRLKAQAAADRKSFSQLTSVFREAAAQIPEAAEDTDACAWCSLGGRTKRAPTSTHWPDDSGANTSLDGPGKAFPKCS